MKKFNADFCIIAWLSCLFFTHSLLCHQSYEKQITVVITSYNNALWVQKNLDSVCNQLYENFNVIYVDDASIDGTADIVENYIKNHKLTRKITLIKNNEHRGKLYNIYHAYHTIDDWNIIVQLDGDDWFVDNQVLNKINNAYCSSNAWFVYSNYMFSSGKIMHSKVPSKSDLKNLTLRKVDYAYVHIRTFYAWLFKLIELKDLLTDKVPGFEGKFYPRANDSAIIYPMLEMAQYHIKFINEVLYVLNVDNHFRGQDIWPNLGLPCFHEVIQKKSYKPLAKPITKRLENLKNAQADVVVFSWNNPHGLKNVLESLQRYCSGINIVYIVYESDIAYKNEYQAVKDMFESVIFLDFSESTLAEYKNNVWQFFKNYVADYIFLIDDFHVLKDSINIERCRYFLEKTFAYGFYMGLEHDNEHGADQIIEDDVYAFKFNGNFKWSEYNNSSFTLYRKKDLIDLIDAICYGPAKALVKWKKSCVNLNNVGLFF